MSAAAATVAVKTERELHRHIYDRPTVQTKGFGLAQVKPEGGRMLYDDTEWLKPFAKDENEWFMMTHRKPTYITSVHRGVPA